MSDDRPPREGTHRGWKVRITTRRVEWRWAATVEVWRPGRNPQTYAAEIAPFSGRFDSAEAAEDAAWAALKIWIDREEGAAGR